MSRDDWPERDAVAHDMLYIVERDKSSVVYNAGGIFIRDDNGTRETYNARAVNDLLVSEDTPQYLKENMLELIPHLADTQQAALVRALSEDALYIIEQINLPVRGILAEIGSPDIDHVHR